MNFLSGKVRLILLTLIISVEYSKALGLHFKLNVLQNNMEIELTELIKNIYEEETFDSILLCQGQRKIGILPSDNFMIPQMIITDNMEDFTYKDFYNSEVLVIFTMSTKMNFSLFQRTVKILDYMRQSRLLIVAENIFDGAKIKNEILTLAKIHKLTNVLMVFVSHLDGEQERQYFNLHPYPDFNWHRWNIKNNTKFFTKHWKNLQNKTLMTYVDQTPSRALVYADAKGQLHMTGFVAKLVLLFAEIYNAQLEMYYPLDVTNKSHYTVVNKMVSDNLLDIPIALVALAALAYSSSRNASDFYEINEILIMVPLSKPLTITQIYGNLLNGNFFACLGLASVIFSASMKVIVDMQKGLISGLDLLMNIKILPGVLGLAFSSNPYPKMSLKIYYILLGYFGLNLATLFTAHINTLLTSPPYNPQIWTLDDLRRRGIKGLSIAGDPALDEPKLAPVRHQMELTTNASYYYETRKSLNTSYFYGTTTATFNILNRQQQYFYSRPIFHAPEGVKIYTMLPWAFQLQYNSPYKEALNYLIHRVHAVGLVEAWHNLLFIDMLKLKEVSKNDPNTPQSTQVLCIDDLIYVWAILPIGLGFSSLMFMIELAFGR
ncbi:uncharacterized protein LOC142235990 [Haematobia irritans]|uniref:uncharacterized protein LOC142235990 n=1 Tax=Haematobia irritans TaxID=7368 RepID=UPI003F4FF3E6